MDIPLYTLHAFENQKQIFDRPRGEGLLLLALSANLKAQVDERNMQVFPRICSLKKRNPDRNSNGSQIETKNQSAVCEKPNKLLATDRNLRDEKRGGV